MPATSFDKDPLNANLLLSLPMFEATGSEKLHDLAKPHHPVTQVHAPVWTQLASGLWVLDFDGANDYLQCLAASCADLDFTAGDFSFACWCYWEGVSSDIIAGRYELDVSGWEIYFDDTDPLGSLTLRAHHAGDPAGDRTACNSLGWTKNTWWLVGITRAGAYPLHYRNGQAVEASYAAGGISDPATCAEDLVIGVRYTKNANHYKGKQWKPRIWNRGLSPAEYMEIFSRERAWLGV